MKESLYIAAILAGYNLSLERDFWATGPGASTGDGNTSGRYVYSGGLGGGSGNSWGSSGFCTEAGAGIGSGSGYGSPWQTENGGFSGDGIGNGRDFSWIKETFRCL